MGPSMDAVIASVGDQSQLVIESSVMCDYALTNGYDVPPRVVARLQALLRDVGADVPHFLRGAGRMFHFSLPPQPLRKV